MSVKGFRSEVRKALTAALQRWIDLEFERADEMREWRKGLGHVTSKREALREAQRNRALVRFLAHRVRPHLGALTRDNSHMSADELAELAQHLSPGGAHTGALLGLVIRDNIPFVDPLLMAAIYRYNWHGGKAGFQFLPDPATVDLDDYQAAVWELLDVFDQAADGDPRRILTGKDLAFFDSLPDRFTIYRGARGISPEKIAAGVCWTTKREVAEWFALRGDKPVVMTARCRKAYVRLAKASEFEIVTVPERARVIACRPRQRGWRPETNWAP